MRNRPILVWAALAALCSCEQPLPITGPATVVDGDSLEIAAASVRLYGVDAPEARQSCTRDGARWACGTVATQKLRALIGTSATTCTQKDTDAYGRIVAVCTSGGQDLGAELVRAGLALAYRQYSDDYVQLEDTARAARRGIWAGDFTPPWEWRQNPQQDDGPVQRADGDCFIKGNINRAGARIYHLPGSSAYAQTIIDESRGERWFCSEDEARRAGWRAPRG